jgi:hypothetical protein
LDRFFFRHFQRDPVAADGRLSWYRRERKS